MRATRPTIPWATGAGGGLATWAVAVALSAAGCGDDVAVQGIAFELAASTTNGAAACLEAVAALPDTVDCVGISLCQREGTGCTPIPLSRPGGSPHMGEPLLVPLDANRAVRFDAPIPDGDVEMEVVVYADGAAIAEGSGLLSRGAAPAVLLHPYEAASCAGGGTDGVAPRSRALHAAMAMPNGDVLIFGGVSGERVPVYGLALGARLQRGVDVFLGREGRFAPVTVIGAGAVEGGLGRVLFTAIPLDAAADGRQRIRLLGGLTVDGDTPAVRFDASQGLTHHGLPLVPGEAATIAASLDLLYDPGARVLEVLEIADDSASPGAMASASGDPFQDRRVIVAGMADTGAVLAPPRPTLAARIQFRDGAGDATAEAMLAASRLGATVAPIGRARDRLLVWGGDIDFATGGEVDAFAGEIVALDATGRPSTTALPAMPTLPAPVVLHTASPIGDDGVLVAGGLVVGSLESPGQGVTTRSPADGLVVVAPEGPNWVVRAVADDRYMPSVYHSHVTAPLGASPPVALIIGGATDPSSCDGDGDCWGDQHCEVTTGTCAIADCAPGGPCPAVKLLPSGQVVRVEEDGAGAYATEPLTPGFSPRGLLRPRFGHVVVPLAGDRLLVTGGFDLTVGDDGAPQVRTMGTAEILFYRRAPAPIPSCGE